MDGDLVVLYTGSSNACHSPCKISEIEDQSVFEIVIVLGFNDTSTLEGHFVSSPREREKRGRRE